MSDPGANTDVTELVALLQCLGFTVKSLEVNDDSQTESHDTHCRTVVINCQTSGYHVVLENSNGACSCPVRDDLSGVWQSTGVIAGKAMPKEIGSAFLCSFSRPTRDRLSQELRRLMQSMLELNESSQLDRSKSKSTCMLETASPEKRDNQLKVDSPIRYRSLDTLSRNQPADPDLPPPGSLEKPAMFADEKRRRLCARQDTYTIRRPNCHIPHICNKTSSPIQANPSLLLNRVLEAHRAAEELQLQLALVIEELNGPMVRGVGEDSIADLNVSKISLFKATETPKYIFASSPNLSGMSAREDFMKTSAKNEDMSASTSKLGTSKVAEKKGSKFSRISPNFFKSKKDKPAGSGPKEGKSKLQTMFKPRIVTPVQDSSQNLSNISSINKKRFSHIKSTIPRPSPTPSRKE